MLPGIRCSRLRMRTTAVEAGDEPKTPVPLTIILPAETRQLIISGPNTGGKTVSLKTLGLLSIMAQSGVPVPAEEAKLPLFTRRLRRHRRRAIYRARSLQFLRPRRQPRSHLPRSHRRFARPPRRVRLRHRPRRRRSPCRCGRLALPHRQRVVLHHHPPHLAQGLCRQPPRCAQRGRRL